MANNYSAAAASTRNPRRRGGAAPSGSGATAFRTGAEHAGWGHGGHSVGHLRSHSHPANQAGDVFAAFGSNSGSISTRKRTEDSSSNKAAESLKESLSSESSSPSMPSTFQERAPSARRFKALYSRPDLLKLWTRERSVNVVLGDLYSACDQPPEHRPGPEDPSPSNRFYQRSSQDSSIANEHGIGLYKRGKIGDLSGLGQLGRSSGSTAGLDGRSLVNGRRNDRYGSVGVQDGAVHGPGNGHKSSTYTSRGGLSKDRERPRLPRSACLTDYIANVKEYQEKAEKAQASVGEQMSNRWRYLKNEDDTPPESRSVSSERDRDNFAIDKDEEPYSTGADLKYSLVDERPEVDTSAAAKQQEIAVPQPAQNGLLEDWDAVDTSFDEPIPATAEGATSLAGSTNVLTAEVSSVPISVSEKRFWSDELLTPALHTRLSNTGGFPSEQHPVAAAVMTSPSTSAAVITDTLSLLNPKADNPEYIGPILSRSISGQLTPTRAQASEGLDILARRSPVQEVSMAHLQQQSFQQQQQQQQQHSVASTSRSVNPETIFWHYRDPQGHLQGPFSATQMQEWYLQGFFSDTLLVKRVDSLGDFEELGALLIRTGDREKPFLTPITSKMFAPPGILAIGQPHLNPLHPNRTSSSAAWHRPAAPTIASQSSSRNGSMSAYPDRFSSPIGSHIQYSAHDEIHFPQSSVHQQHPTTASPDPWADTLSFSPAISRGASQQDHASGSKVAIEAPIQPPLRKVPLLHSSTSELITLAHYRSGQDVAAVPFDQPLNQQNAAAYEYANSTDKWDQLEKGASSANTDIATPTISESWQVLAAHTVHEPFSPRYKPSQVGTDSSHFHRDHLAEAARIDYTSLQPSEVQAHKLLAKAPADDASTIMTTSSHESVPSNDSHSAIFSRTNPESPSTIQDPALPIWAKTGVPNDPTLTLKVLTSRSELASGSSRGAKISIVTRDSFDKQKKGTTVDVPPASEFTFDVSMLPQSGSSGNVASSKAAPWTKPEQEAVSSARSLPTSNSALSLRDIQDKEQKETSIRKAAEKKLHAAQLAAEEAALLDRLAKETTEILPASSTWAASSALPFIIPSSSNQWMKPSQSPIHTSVTASNLPKKKTLKEIQEEEEARRKKAASVSSNAVAASGKGYAGSIGMPKSGTPPATPSSAGTWTTIGPTKPTAGLPPPVVLASAKSSNGAQSLKPVIPASSFATSLNYRPTSASPALAIAQAKPTLRQASNNVITAMNGRSGTPVGRAMDDSKTPASPELLKWCREALKGLDIPSLSRYFQKEINMLLSFPVPIDKSTRELISDSVYSSSRTLDGRYFADAFADKRASDLKAIKSGKTTPVSVSLQPSPKPVTFTEVLKTVPQKTVEPNFKIVTKKQGKTKK